MIPPHQIAAVRADPRVQGLGPDRELYGDYMLPCPTATVSSRPVASRPTATALPGYLTCRQPGIPIPNTYGVILALPASGLTDSDAAQIADQLGTQYGLRVRNVLAESFVAQIPPEQLAAVRADARVHGVGLIIAMSIDGDPVVCPTPPPPD